MTFFALLVIGFIYIVVINGTLIPQFTTLVNSGTLIPMDSNSTATVLGGFSQVSLMLKILIPGLFLAALVAVIVFILFRREEENVQG